MENRKTNRTGMEIAVIGMDGRFPGSNDLNEFWNNILKGEESIQFFTDEELLKEGHDQELLQNPNYIKAKGILKNAEYFDYKFFDYTLKQATVMDPQSRLLHECIYNALEDSSYSPYNYKGNIGLFIGSDNNIQWQAATLFEQMKNSGLDFEVMQLVDKDEFNLRISYKLNLRGPSLSVKSACSTSLTAVHLACRSLLMGESKIAIAGGVSMTSPVKRGYLYQKGFVRSQDGHCKPFSSDATGFVSGDGVGIVVLKLLKHALDDKDSIHAIIRGTAINNDGNRKIGYTAPSIDAQAEVIKKAHRLSKVDAKDIGYIEAHGSATELGDPIEVEAIKTAFGEVSTQNCALGSVKSNIGHLNSAAGIAGMIKTILILKNKIIPANKYFQNPNPKLNLINSPLFINKESKEWVTNNVRIAGLNSLGMGGANAHMILEEAPLTSPEEQNDGWKFLVFSAKNPNSLEKMSQKMIEYLEKNMNINLSDVEYSLKKGRINLNYKRMLICKKVEDAILSLKDNKSVNLVSLISRRKPKLIFMFPGQGSQFLFMGNHLYNNFQVFKDEFDNCAILLKKHCNIDIIDKIYPKESNEDCVREILRTSISQPILFSFEYALVKLLNYFGIEPDATIGYSFGEYVSACISGVFTLEDALKLVEARGRLMEKVPKGKMLSVPLSEEKLLPLLDDGVNIAIDNEQSCIVSGVNNKISEFHNKLKKERILCFPLDLNHAGHSVIMKDIIPEFEAVLDTIDLKRPRIPFVSNVTGKFITSTEAVSKSYWLDHLTGTVKFATGFKELVKDDNTIFIEVGPGRELSILSQRFINKKINQKNIALIRRDDEEHNEEYFFSKALNNLFLNGVEIDWDNFYINNNRARLHLPTYPFEKYRFPISKIINVNNGITVCAEESGLGVNESNSYDSQDEDFNETTQLRNDISASYVPPENLIEEEIIDIWQSVFGDHKIGIKDDFFELGGDSLKAVTILGKIQVKFNAEVSFKKFFKNPTVKYLKSQIENNYVSHYALMKPSEKREFYPISNTEKRMFVMDMFDKASINYNVPRGMLMKGKLDTVKLKQSFKKLVKRHEVLRTCFRIIENDFFQMIKDEVIFEIPIQEVTEDTLEQELIKFVIPFDLINGPLFRLKLLKLNSEKYILLTDFHHIILDGYTSNIFTSDFLQYYNESQIAPLKLQYKDFAIWQQEIISEKELLSQKEYWLNIYKKEVPDLGLFTDYKRPTVISYKGASVYTYFDDELKNKIERLSINERVTTFIVQFAAYNILLMKYTNATDIVIGGNVEGRNYKELRNVAGVFASTVALRTKFNKEDTFNNFLENAMDVVLNGFENSDYQLDELLEAIEYRTNPNRNPLFDTMFVSASERSPLESVSINELSVESYQVNNRGSKVDLLFEIIPTSKGVLLEVQYATLLYKESTVKKMVEDYFYILHQVCDNKNSKLDEIKVKNNPLFAKAFIPDFSI